MSRVTLKELRRLVWLELDYHDWRTPTEVGRALGLDSGLDYYRVALTLERLCVQGYVEIKDPNGTFRRFRRRQGVGGTGAREPARSLVIRQSHLRETHVPPVLGVGGGDGREGAESSLTAQGSADPSPGGRTA